MLMKCKTCTKEFIPPRKNVRNCGKCIIFKKAKNMEEASIKDEGFTHSSTNNDSNASEPDIDTIEQQPTISDQFSNGEMMCGSVIIDDSSSNNMSIKQYISMINEDINSLLKQSQIHIDATELDSGNTITDNLIIVHEKVKKLNKSIKPNDEYNENVISLLKIIYHKVDDNSQRLNDLKNTLI